MELMLTGDSMDKVDGIGEPAEVEDGPVEGVLAVRAVIDGYENVSASPPLTRLSLQLWLWNDRYQRLQFHLSPAVLLFLLQRLHLYSLPQPRRKQVAFVGFRRGELEINMAAGSLLFGFVHFKARAFFDRRRRVVSSFDISKEELA